MYYQTHYYLLAEKLEQEYCNHKNEMGLLELLRVFLNKKTQKDNCFKTCFQGHYEHPVLFKEKRNYQTFTILKNEDNNLAQPMLLLLPFSDLNMLDPSFNQCSKPKNKNFQYELVTFELTGEFIVCVFFKSGV